MSQKPDYTDGVENVVETEEPQYTVGEKVLCYHGPLLYEAKCLKVQINDKTIKYFIHYSGWNKNWDEWVPESRVLKFNEEHLTKQKELEQTHRPKKKSKSTKSSSKKATEKEKEKGKEEPTPVVHEKPVKQPKAIKRAARPAEALSKPPEPKKAKLSIERQFEEEPEAPVEIKFTIPDNLIDWLVDDLDLITHQKIVRLPARVTVDHVIANYVKQKVSDKMVNARKEVTLIRVTNRIRDCFNVLLGKQLLNKFERPQYAEILAEHSGQQMCEIYGAIHLLRMFKPLSTLLTSLARLGRNISVLVAHVQDFIMYMAQNPSFFSLDDYVVTSPEYQRRA